MNVWGFLMVLAGVLMIIVGFTGSQHRILDILKGVHFTPNPVQQPQPPSPKPSAPSTTPGGGTLL